MLCPIKVNSNTIDCYCYCVLDVLCVKILHKFCTNLNLTNCASNQHGGKQDPVCRKYSPVCLFIALSYPRNHIYLFPSHQIHSPTTVY